MAHGPRLGQILGDLSLYCAGRPARVVTIIAVGTLLAGAGMVQLETDADLLKILPKNHPATLAAQNASTEFRGFYDLVTFFYAIDAEKCARVTASQLPYHGGQGDPQAPDCGNVTHEAYVRGMDEVWHFIRGEIPQAEYAIDFANLIKVVNWTNDGYVGDSPEESLLAPLVRGETDRVGRPPDDEAFRMPGTDPMGALQYYAAYRGALAADEAATDTVARTFEAGRTIIFFNTTDGISRVELGRAVYATVDAYAAAVAACDDGDSTTPCTLTWNVFDTGGLAVRGVAATDAHASDTTKRDISVLAPLIIWAIVAILYLAFRDPRVILVSALNLFTAFVWTAGMMGWLEIPFSALNMTIVPLILGVGIDYGIHMVSEFLEHKADRRSNAEAFQEAGHRAGFAMFIATVTTVAGLLIMVASPSILMAQLGIVSSIALVVTFVFTLTLIPAVLSLTAKEASRREHRGSPWVATVAGAVGRRRPIAIVAAIVLTGMAFASMQNLEAEGFGNPELNYPPGDRVRDDAEWLSREFFGADAKTQSNYLIVEGDLTQPETHVFLDALTANLEADPDIQGFNTASLTRVVRGWMAVNQGTPDAIASQFVLSNVPAKEVHDAEYPKSPEEMRRMFDDIFASPLANFMTILLAPDTYDIGMVSFDTDQDTNFAESERIWEATLRVIEKTRQETGITEDQLQVNLFGNNAFSYLFITEEMPWVNTVGIVSFTLVVIMVGLATRNLRATSAIASVMLVTSIWWLGVLPLMDIGLSVGLMLPMVFIMAIGSDDAIHLIWNMEQTRDRRKVYRFVGQAVLLTSLTTFIAFSIFSRQTDLLVTRTLLATAVAVLQMWLATMLVVPVFYPPGAALDAGAATPEGTATTS